MISLRKKLGHDRAFQWSLAMAYGDWVLACAALSMLGALAVAWHGAVGQVDSRLVAIHEMERFRLTEEQARKLDRSVAEQTQALEGLKKQISDEDRALARKDQQLAQSQATVAELQKRLSARPKHRVRAKSRWQR